MKNLFTILFLFVFSLGNAQTFPREKTRSNDSSTNVDAFVSVTNGLKIPAVEDFYSLSKLAPVKFMYSDADKSVMVNILGTWKHLTDFKNYVITTDSKVVPTYSYLATSYANKPVWFTLVYWDLPEPEAFIKVADAMWIGVEVKHVLKP